MSSGNLPHTECPDCQLLFTPTEHDDLIKKLVDEIKDLKAENFRLREALAVYTNPEYWRATQGDDQSYILWLF